MHSFAIITFCSALLYPSVLGTYSRDFSRELESGRYDFEYNPEEVQNDTLSNLNNSSDISINTSDYRTNEQRLESNSLASKSVKTVLNPKLTLSSLAPPIEIIPSNQSTEVDVILTEIFSNESDSTSSPPSNSPSSSTTVKTSIQSMNISKSTNEKTFVSSTEDEEEEEVIRGTPSGTENMNTTTSNSETFYQKAVALINDAYTLSILIPVAAGVVFAATIIVTIATCRCLRRQCRRRRLRRKNLPDSVKHLRPSDRARLLAESSDEEF